MLKSNYEVEILVNGHPIKEYLHKDGRYFVEGRKGQEYSIKIRNNGYQRILAVPTVDGLSVLNGKEASYDSSGYIINGYSSYTIKGWRRSNSEVAEFYFSDPSESYASRKDKGQNLGVIGVAIFREKVSYKPVEVIVKHEHHHWPCHDIFCPICNPKPFNWDYSWPKYSSGGSLGSANDIPNNIMMCSASCENKNYKQEERSLSAGLGTGWGQTIEDKVQTIDFDKESSPDAVFEFYYNTRENLEKAGIDLSLRPVYVSPQAFPNQYCEPPK